MTPLYDWRYTGPDWLMQYVDERRRLYPRKNLIANHLGLPVYKGQTIFGTGWLVDGHGRPVSQKTYLSMLDANRTGHTLIIGSTRVGKSMLMRGIIAQGIIKGNSIIVFDPKPDGGITSDIISTAIYAGRENELIVIDVADPRISGKINPLAIYYTPEELVSHLTSGVSAGKEPFFKDVAYSTAMNLTEAELLLAKLNNRPSKLSIEHVMENIKRSNFEKIAGELKATGTPEGMKIAARMDAATQTTPDYFAKINMSLGTALTRLSSGNIGKIVGPANNGEPENSFIHRLERGERIIMIVRLHSQLAQESSFTLAKLILSMIQSYAGRVNAKGMTLPIPLEIHMDEFQNVLYPNLDNGFAMMGGTGIYLHGYCQALAQIYREFGEDYGKTILTNTNTKGFMRCAEADTAKELSNYFGTTNRKYNVVDTRDGRITARDVSEELVKSENFQKLQKREILMTTYADEAFTGLSFGQTMDIYPPLFNVSFPPIDYLV